jgi:hypothetical protein
VTVTRRRRDARPDLVEAMGMATARQVATALKQLDAEGRARVLQRLESEAPRIERHGDRVLVWVADDPLLICGLEDVLG